MPALLARGVNVNACELYPLRHSSINVTALWHACSNEHEDVALLLIAAGANVRLGSSCYVACSNNMPRVMAALREAGADTPAPPAPIPDNE